MAVSQQRPLHYATPAKDTGPFSATFGARADAAQCAFEDAMQATDWRVVVDTDEVKIALRDVGGGLPVQACCTAILEAAPLDVMSVMVNLEKRAAWDATVNPLSRTVESFEDELGQREVIMVMHTNPVAGGMISGRQFINALKVMKVRESVPFVTPVRRTVHPADTASASSCLHLNEGSWLNYGIGLEDHDRVDPPPKGIIRALSIAGGGIYEPIGVSAAGVPLTKYTMMFQSDIRGWIPVSVINNAISSSCQALFKNLRKHLQSVAGKRKQTDGGGPHNKSRSNSTSVTGADDSKGRSRSSSSTSSATDEDIESLHEAFRLSEEWIRALPPKAPQQPSNDVRLRFYGLYKQSTSGDCNVSAPSVLSVVARAKWQAWNDLKGQSPLEAKQEYVRMVINMARSMRADELPDAFAEHHRQFLAQMDQFKLDTTGGEENKQQSRGGAMNHLSSNVVALAPKQQQQLQVQPAWTRLIDLVFVFLMSAVLLTPMFTSDTTP